MGRAGEGWTVVVCELATEVGQLQLGMYVTSGES